MEAEKHLVSLKVIRIISSTPASSLPVTCDSNEDLPGNPSNNDLYQDPTSVEDTEETLGPGQFILQPEIPVNIYIDETLSCHTFVHNESEAVLNNISLKVLLLSSSRKITFYYCNPPTPELPPDEKVHNDIYHTLKNFGAHTLLFEVNYQLPSGAPMSFRKIFKVMVLRTLNIETRLTESGDDFYLKAEIQNMTAGPICLEKITLVASPVFSVLSSSTSDESISTKKTTIFPQAVCRFLYCLQPNNKDLVHSDMNFGKLDIIWKSNLSKCDILETIPLYLDPPEDTPSCEGQGAAAATLPDGNGYPKHTPNQTRTMKLVGEKKTDVNVPVHHGETYSSTSTEEESSCGESSCGESSCGEENLSSLSLSLTECKRMSNNCNGNFSEEKMERKRAKMERKRVKMENKHENMLKLGPKTGEEIITDLPTSAGQSPGPNNTSPGSSGHPHQVHLDLIKRALEVRETKLEAKQRQSIELSPAPDFLRDIGVAERPIKRTIPKSRAPTGASSDGQTSPERSAKRHKGQSLTEALDDRSHVSPLLSGDGGRPSVPLDSGYRSPEVPTSYNGFLEPERSELQVVVLSSRIDTKITREEVLHLYHNLVTEMIRAMETSDGTDQALQLRYRKTNIVGPGWLKFFAQDELSADWLLNSWSPPAQRNVTFTVVRAAEAPWPEVIGFEIKKRGLNLTHVSRILPLQNRALGVDTWEHLETTGGPWEWNLIYRVSQEVVKLLEESGWVLYFELRSLTVRRVTDWSPATASSRPGTSKQIEKE
ncbi:hypothetical protein JTB14_012304 [Gonioctena quinquepunctata]|nr:hypothetical protein JTB14_012304 [Gonioctena quinquepunctata]